MKRHSLPKIGIMVAGGVGLVFLWLFGYAGASEPNKAVDPRLISANTKFGFHLLAELLNKDGEKNVFISPSSVAMALTMTYNGAGNQTQQAMANALQLQGLSLDQVNRANAALRSALESTDPKVQLIVANSLWARKGFLFKPEFIKRNQDFYGAKVTELNFDDPQAPSTINTWVRDKTNGKIPQMVDRIARETILFLINAVYFKGRWTVEFDKNKTKENGFTLLNGTQKKHPMMSQSGHYKYLQGKGFQAVSLPYGTGRMSMYVFLPDKSSGLKAFYRNLTAENWNQWISQLHDAQGTVVLPRFKLEYEAILNDALKSLGMEIAFDGHRANFTNMSSMANACINQVKHKTFVEVNEEGTEAAAATSVEMRAVSMGPTFSMVVDRPFFCAIRDNETGTILFMGSIVDPK